MTYCFNHFTSNTMKKYILSISICLYALLGFAQQFPDRHSTSKTDAWLSCSTSQNPNSERGNSHWIQYDLGSTYVLDVISLWNYNDPSNLNNGVQEIAIDVSSDGINWSEAAISIVAISDGSAFYQGEELISLGGISANYVLITVLNNHGGSCSGFSELKITTAAILPIELTKFDARCVDTGDGVTLAWKTDSEVDNDFFTIQRSTNAIDWVDVMDVPSKGQNGQGAEYYEIDKNVSGVLYYRLANTDLDGQRQYFDLVTVDCDDIGPMIMTVANPFTESLTFSYHSNGPAEVNYSIKGIDGRIVNEGLYNVNDAQRISIPSAHWSNGTYIITIYENAKRITKKVVKM